MLSTQYRGDWCDAVPFVESFRYLSWGIRFISYAPDFLIPRFESWIQNELPLHLISLGQVIEKAEGRTREFIQGYPQNYLSTPPNALRLTKTQGE